MALDQCQNQNSRIGKACLFVMKVTLVLVLSCAVAVAYLAVRSRDPVYVLRELKDWTDYRRFDPLIVRIAREYGLDPRLIKAVVWRESRFQADMIGRNGERGLMQVSEIAARDWAAAKGVRDLHPEQILIPETNLEIGTWYLGKAVQRWNSEDNAVPFALAEYNAGKSRVDRWIRTALRKRGGAPVTAQTFQDSIDFPSTARYVRAILARYDFYKRRGPLLVGEPGRS
ncbi:MAG: lytic transglycosylase domain-containing protein [Verrucomicrobia bacterium]|nr:lytic transglycosylase domain-containing protein [Verrucomicrobiota bacterium]MBV8377027.1 lytic transglycosylase domain-containing protein [Verrucomicrobiota bacterium]